MPYALLWAISQPVIVGVQSKIQMLPVLLPPPYSTLQFFSRHRLLIANW